MTQSNFSLANQSGASFRTALNTALQALATCSSGNSAPSTTYPYQLWQDTSSSPAVLNMRNAANSAWVTLGVWGDASLFTLFTNGSERLRVTSGGLVGIGRTPTTYALEVQGDINATGNLRVNGVAVGALADDSVTYAKLQNAGANTILARAASTSGDLGEVALAVSQLIGRGATGDIAPITLGTGLTMVGTALSLASGGGGRLLGAPQVFTANGTYTKGTNNPTFIIVEGRGGGGGGGASGQAIDVRAGAGGGQGGYFLKYFLASGLSNSTSVTVGSGGAAGGGGAGSNGGNGGNTIFSTCTAGGGSGGDRGNEKAAAKAGNGGTSSGGDVNIRGDCGVNGVCFSVNGVDLLSGGAGGGDGGGLGGVGDSDTGSAAAANTGGGGGGGTTNSSLSVNGGAGGNGWLRIWEYL